jgi:hypothetical protein
MGLCARFVSYSMALTVARELPKNASEHQIFDRTKQATYTKGRCSEYTRVRRLEVSTLLVAVLQDDFN